MIRFVSWVSAYCLRNNIVSEEDLSWFRYGVEKRVTTLLVGIPFLLLAIVLTDVSTAVCFFAAFYFIRSRTNGYHANSFCACFVQSLITELLILCVVFPLINGFTIYILGAICAVFIFFFAPYNHPNMHLSEREIAACRTSSRIRILILLGFASVFLAFGWQAAGKGLILGIAMAAFLLCLAYILNGGIKHEKRN